MLEECHSPSHMMGKWRTQAYCHCIAQISFFCFYLEQQLHCEDSLSDNYKAYIKWEHPRRKKRKNQKVKCEMMAPMTGSEVDHRIFIFYLHLSPGLQIHIPSCLLNTFTWLSHYRLNGDKPVLTVPSAFSNQQLLLNGASENTWPAEHLSRRDWALLVTPPSSTVTGFCLFCLFKFSLLCPVPSIARLLLWAKPSSTTLGP